ncbi:hypothetical protein THAOC_16186 [Thalassiosira oceanica]|uniref:Uncharacterized protein n=1 Tax=Thalassiosira oceanica TaxID=159749 RepID=K0SE00_THAOC|nr:hypothetical protein THAOC_16186 [Thalassiosira oceanica]|eukprot:EJK63174.1 hypothetical protein THAOC_16186 [Thalassiosira oceanica]
MMRTLGLNDDGNTTTKNAQETGREDPPTVYPSCHPFLNTTHDTRKSPAYPPHKTNFRERSIPTAKPIMMAESPTGDEEAQQPAASRAVAVSQQSNGTFLRKKALLGSFLFIAAVLAIALGVAFGGGDGTWQRRRYFVSTDGADDPDVVDSVTNLDAQPDVGDDGDEDNTGTDEPDVIIDSVTNLDVQPDVGDDGDGDNTGADEPDDVIDSLENVDGTGGQPPPEVSEAVDPPPLDTEVPPVVQAKFLRSSGPLESRVRIASPDIANGYSSCDDLKDDIVEALKFYANSIIMSEQSNDWYEKCDPKNSNYWWGGEPEYALAAESTSALDSAAAPPALESISAPQAEVSGKVDSPESTESSYGNQLSGQPRAGTNNQVDGVDEADIVKSDGKHVYAAYGDLLFVWNATDSSAGMSVTKIPQDSYENCTRDNPIKPWKPFPVPEPLPEEVVFENVRRRKTHMEHHRHLHPPRHSRQALSIAPGWHYNPCTKPRILSLLLHGKRLTTIVSENRYRGLDYTYEAKIIDDYSTVYARVYDVSDPQDAKPLTLLSETVIKGSYNSARSINSKGFVFSTSYINTWPFSEGIYRSHPDYCGMNSSQYVTVAAEKALNKTDDFAHQLLDELQLQLEGTCEDLFQIAALQSGDNGDDNIGGQVLENMVLISSFDMAADEVETHTSGAFSSGYLSSVYASQDFAAAMNVGSNYNALTNSWDQSTFILGFDLSGELPMPFAFAEVPGSPLNQYSSDYYDGNFRIVTTQTQWSWDSVDSESRTTNILYVLGVPGDQEGAEMPVIGKTTHLGKPNESVFAVRLIQDKAYVVTFERTDPFYIIDLSNATKPEMIGELQIPGFSSYLHPINISGVPLMLGIGEDVSEDGRRIGVKVSMFDVSNSSNPVENATFVDKGAYSAAGSDFYGFRYLPSSQKLIIPKSKYTTSSEGNFDGFVVYDIDLGDISEAYEIEHASSRAIWSGCWYDASMPARSLVFDGKITTVLSHSVIGTDLTTGEKEWNVSLAEGVNKTQCHPYFM